MKTVVKIVLTILLTVLAFVVILVSLNLATGKEVAPRGGGWLVIPLSCWFIAAAIVDKSGYWTREAAIGAARTGMKVQRVAKSISKEFDSIRKEAKDRESLVVQPEVDFQDSVVERRKLEFINGARNSMTLAVNPMPSPSLAQEKMLCELYGDEWFQRSKDLISSCLVFLEECRFISDADLQSAKVFRKESLGFSLLNAYNCAALAGALTVPTVPKNEPDFLSFALALGVDDPAGALTDPKSNTQLLLHAAKLRRILETTDS